MQLGISSYTFTWAVGVPGHPPERPMRAVDLLDKAAELGVRLVQVADNLPLDQLAPAALDAFEKRASELGIEIEVGTRGIGLDHLCTYLQLAERLRSPILRVVVDTADHHPTEDQIVGTIKEIVPEFERAGIYLAIENHDRFTAKQFAKIVERVGSRYVGICLDTVNSLGALEGPEAVLEVLGPWVVNLHVKDFTIFRASHTMGFSIEGRPAGQGKLNIPWLLEKLRDQGRDPNAILELWTPPEGTLSATIAKEDAWAAASVEYLRKLIPGQVGQRQPEVARNPPYNVLRYGKDEPLPEKIALRAGPLTMIYEAGDLRYVKLGDREVLRRVYVAIRDRNWGTVPPTLSNVQMDVANDSFHITYDVENTQGEIDFFWQGAITGDAQGTITFTMEGVARSTFMRNRVGFCVLHPIRECAGQPCTIEKASSRSQPPSRGRRPGDGAQSGYTFLHHEKADGAFEQGTFPEYISPHQPFVDIRAISHQVVPGVRAEVRFAGDVFEMEDQRNWTDASYKTYCTPLALPFPAKVEEGTRISQSVTLTLQGDVPQVRDGPRDTAILLSIGQSPAGPVPRIGLGVASHGQPLTQKELMRLKALNLSHLRVDLDLTRPDYGSALRRAAAEADALDVPLEVALHLSDAAAEELEAFAGRLEQVGPAVCTWLIFHVAEQSTTEKWIHLARKRLTDYAPEAKFGAGTDANFTELNRRRPPVAALDLVSYSINPQVHAFDNTSLVEALETQAATVESARRFVAGLPLAISPITLRPRFNPSATGPESEPTPGELPSQVDVRQMSLFGAAWTAGSLKYVSESGVYSVTYYETSGWRGVMETEVGSPLPDKFRSWPGSVFPLYHVLANVGEFAGGEVILARSSDTLRVDGLALRKEGRTRVILANLSPELQRVTVRNLSQRVRIRHLDETNAKEAMQSPERFRAREGEGLMTLEGSLELSLRPYAIARLDTWELGS